MAATVRVRVTPKVMGRLRLASQGLLGAGFTGVPEAVRSMAAMQAQDLQAALWAVGIRVPGAGLSDVRRALDDGSLVRSWPMRGTLHLLAPEDLRWILNITTARMVQGTAGRHRQLEITGSDIEACREAALGLVDGGRAASREELFAAFEAAGQPTRAQRGIHLLWMLCQSATLVPGPLDGNQQKFVAFDQWITTSRDLDREEGIAELLLRYLRGHGPATLRDFAWWSSIPLTEVRRALPAVKSELAELEYDGTQYWTSPEAAALLDEGVPGQRSVLALPGFDEFVLGYTDRSIVLPPEHAQKVVPGGNGVFKKTVVAGGEVTGTWARQGSGRTSAVVPVPFDDTKPLGPAALAGFRRAAERYEGFLVS
ncbi:winged helix DNA-binding domain-containing protein [Arthrobacter sp. FW305-BF8]|uniref:winged helix DNA-binding domain-containing protein n=1 Tax=Arthrobacter sp. FW305-BF8 TaxID=2879617 RepID=UPI001F35B2E0|nr:winged helix DNA-binding domain-containing protein [Arthrobacter sp. FW305-BF8]UKA53250.1 winged helix DNA-binding domain-containing protein [Arthrobacter sp. FW305-BF8]